MKGRIGRLACVVAFVVLALAGPAQAQDTDNQFTGTWVHWSPTEGGPVPNLVTIHPDGTLTVTSWFMFGGGVSENRISPIHAVWEKAGPNSIRVTSMFFVFDGTGSLLALQRNSCTLQLGASHDRYTGTETMLMTPCASTFKCPDPFDPDTPWVPAGGPFDVIGQRLKVVK